MRSARGSIVGRLLDIGGLKPKEDITQEVKPNRITKDNEDLQKIISRIESTLNPFYAVVNNTNTYIVLQQGYPYRQKWRMKYSIFKKLENSGGMTSEINVL